MKNFWNYCWIVVIAMLAVACGRGKELPELEDGLKLQQDCARLMGQFPSGEISKSIWPTSIRQLEPIRVTRETNCIRILVKQERGTTGYDVFADTRFSPSTRGVWVQKTKFKGVYIFKTF